MRVALSRVRGSGPFVRARMPAPAIPRHSSGDTDRGRASNGAPGGRRAGPRRGRRIQVSASPRDRLERFQCAAFALDSSVFICVKSLVLAVGPATFAASAAATVSLFAQA